MTHQYLVKGITCGGCISNVKKALESVPGVTEVVVTSEAPQATIKMEYHVDTARLQEAVKQYGQYQLTDLQ